MYLSNISDNMLNSVILSAKIEGEIYMTKYKELVSETERNILTTELDLMNQYVVPSSHRYKQSLDWNNTVLWNELPYPKHNSVKGKANLSKTELETKKTDDSVFGEVLQQRNQNSIQKIETNNLNLNNNNRFLCEKYFKKWKIAASMKTDQNINEDLIKRQREKLDLFIKELKKHKKSVNEKYTENNILDNNKEHKLNIRPKPNSNYKNRFKAQKTIIEMQKARLEEQNEIIQNLKLGIISKDIESSMKKTKVNIREIFSDCSWKVKYKIPLVFVEPPKITVNTQKAPKIVQKMEQKAVERAEKRQLILERKRVIEEVRQKVVEETIKKKRALEEEEKKQNLEIIKERRKKELEIERIRQANKQIFMEKWNKAINFYNKILIKTCFQKLYNNMLTSQESYGLAVRHYRNSLLKKCISDWIILLENSYEIKYSMADALFEYKILKKCFSTLCNARLESVRNMQVAEDIYDFRLLSNVFIHWTRYANGQFMIQEKNMKKAENHYKRWLLFHYFYQWRSLKAVIQLEKAKEIKKERWRQKVWEILPDYKPPEKF